MKKGSRFVYLLPFLISPAFGPPAQLCFNSYWAKPLVIKYSM